MITTKKMPYNWWIRIGGNFANQDEIPSKGRDCCNVIENLDLRLTEIPSIFSIIYRVFFVVDISC